MAPVPETPALGFIHSIALLVAMALILDMVGKPTRPAANQSAKRRAPYRAFFYGLITGGVGILVMFNPWVLRPGILIDSRSILLGTAGLFFGTLPTLIAMVITAAFRYSMGGDGVWAGILVIVFSGTVGIAWRHLRRGALEDISWRELFLFGYAVHVVMLGLMFSMPQATAMEVLGTILIPTLIITPTGTALLGKLMASRLKRERSTETLRADHAGLQVEVEEIQIREERYRLLTENIHDVVWVVDVETLRFLYCSPSVERMRGYTQEEVTAEPLPAALVPAAAKAMTEEIRARAEALRAKPPGAEITYIDEIEQPCKDGSTVWAEAISTFYTNPRTGKVEARGVTRDISQRRRVETALRASQDELRLLLAEAEKSRLTLLSLVEEQKAAEDQIRQLNRELEQRVRVRTAELTSANQELEAFSYSVSHDLRAPLRVLDGFSSALLEEYSSQLDENGQHYVARIQEASRRMGQLINDLLRLSRITRADLNYQQVDLSSIAAAIAADLQAQSPRRRVRFEIASGLTIQGDANMLHIVMENLLGNAFKFTNKREQALVRVGETRRVGETNPPGERVFFVYDNGAGFKMEFANKLFVPFQRLHGPHEFPGSGIGLSIVQRIITRHGGRIWAESDVDQGTTLYFTLGENS
jgi:PAS domain S-box-containing protein